MKKYIVIGFVFLLVSVTTKAVFAEGNSETTALEELGVVVKTDQPEGAVLAFALPDVYILPDSKLYWIVKLWESIRLLIAESPEERATILLEYSKRRLSEGYQLFQKDKIEDAGDAIATYMLQLQEALGMVQSLSGTTERQRLYDALYEQVWYQKAISRVVQTGTHADIFSDLEQEIAAVSDNGSLELSTLPN